tara:strand:- start:83 stop:430 length:348 start_codon:yes stop_codon:yes gene_type:complete
MESKEKTEKFLIGIERIIIEKSKRIEDFKIVIFAIMVGLIGGVVGSFLYDISKVWEKNIYITINILIILIFLILLWALLEWFKSWETEVKRFQEASNHISKYGLRKLKIPKTKSV